MSSISFHIPGIPAPGGSKKIFPIKKAGVPTGKFIVTDAAGQKNKDWRASVVHGAFQAMQEADLPPFDCALIVKLRFTMPRPKAHYTSKGLLKENAPAVHTNMPDVSKLARSTIDAMSRICYRDDSLICEQMESKRYGETPGCEITIVPYADQVILREALPKMDFVSSGQEVV